MSQMPEQADYDVEIHLMRELVMSMLCKMKGVDESSIIFPPEMDGSIESLKRCHDALVNDRFLNQVVFQKIKDEQISNRLHSEHQSKINDICRFIRENRDRFWDSDGQGEPKSLPPLGYVKQINGKEFFLLTGPAFLQAAKNWHRITIAKALASNGLLLIDKVNHYQSKHWVRALRAKGYYYAVNAKIFEFESGAK